MRLAPNFSPPSTTRRVEPEHTLVITDGPQSIFAIGDAKLSRTAIRFRFMPGLFCPSVGGELARIEGLMLTTVSMGVYVDEFSAEEQNPDGVSINGTIYEIAQYDRYLMEHRPTAEDLATKDRRIRISYSFSSRCGGFIVGPREPLINSLSDLTRIYERGASFYAVTSTSRELSITHTLPSFTDPLMERAMLEGIPFQAFH